MTNSLICTTYFSKKIHPNHPTDQHVVGRTDDGRVKQNDIKYIEGWYNSVNNLKLNGVIFYDNLTEQFVSEYETEYVKFIKSDPGVWSNNDGRFFCYLDFLKENKHDNIFLTDGSDVTVVQDPGKIVEAYKEIDIFVCKDSIPLSSFGRYLDVHNHFGWENYFAFSLWMQQGIPLINMGVLGGRYEIVIEFLEAFCHERNKMQMPEFNADMWLGQYVIRQKMNNRNMLIGEPFTSKFKEYQKDREDVYFIHK